MSANSYAKRVRIRRGSVIAVAAVVASLSFGSPVDAGHWHTCGGKVVTIRGTYRSEVIEGTNRDDVIVSKSGDDVIFGLEGDDYLCGNSGNDTVVGGEGRDRAYGGSGRHDNCEAEIKYGCE